MKARTVIVSGASSGVGKAVSQRLLGENCSVIGLARDFSKFECDDMHFKAIEIDFSDLETLANKLKQITNNISSLDALICCAGRGQFGSLEQFSYDQIRSLMDLNFTSQAFLTRSVLPILKYKGSGNIIYIGSEAAITAGRKGAIYSASKFALRGLALALRDECAKSGIRVSIINPGMIKTNFFNDLSFRPGESPDNSILPEDVAEAVSMILNARQGTVFDEINLSPQKKVIQFDKPDPV